MVDEYIYCFVKYVNYFFLKENKDFLWCGRICCYLDKFEVFYIVVIFYDIVKGWNGDYFILGVVDVVNFCKWYNVLDDDVVMIVWLVENYLFMLVVV